MRTHQPTVVPVIESLESRRLLAEISPLLDINTAATARSLVPVFELKGALICTVAGGPGTTGAGGLWRTDGTPEGTYRLGGVKPIEITRVGNTVFFLDGNSLWKTNGTVKGTVVVKEFDSIPTWSPGWELQGSGALLFFSKDGNLWKSNGTANGTMLVSGVSHVGDMTDVNGTLFFSATLSKLGNELWKTDGTASGTLLVKDIRPGTDDSYPSDFTAAGGTLYFTANDPTYGDSFWKTDGTPAGTAMLRDLPDGRLANGFIEAFGKRIFFITYSSETLSQQLWTSDGTGKGTRIVADYIEAISKASAFGDGMLFIGVTDNNVHLYRSDGTPDGTYHVASIADPVGLSPFPSDFISVGDGAVCFVTNGVDTPGTLWISDGTKRGTRPLRTFIHGVTRPMRLGSQLHFSDYDGLWTTDGTTAGTVRTPVLTTGFTDSSPQQFIGSGNTRYFIADDGVHGREIWKTDFTNAGTSLFADAVPGALGNERFYIEAIGSRVILSVASTYASGSFPTLQPGIWVTDGSNSGAKQLQSISTLSPAPLARLGNHVFYLFGNALWRSDGTVAGTIKVKSSDSSDSSFDYSTTIVSRGDRLFFREYLRGRPLALWISDGTNEGTYKLLNEAPVNGPLGLDSIVTDGNGFVISTESSAGKRLWRSDGTPAGTTLLHGTLPGYATALTSFKDQFYFSAGAQLWRTDGTANGTRRVKKLGDNDSGRPVKFVTAGASTLYFMYETDADERQLWRSDGSADGTSLVAGAFVPPAQGQPSSAIMVNEQLYFTADNLANGRELWWSGGTADTTAMVADLRPGPPPSSPNQLFAQGNRLLFVADSATTGIEFQSLDTRAALLGSVFDDANVNGVRGTDESSYSSRRVFLDRDGDGIYDSGEQSVLTNAQGNYRFDDLAPGRYRVCTAALANHRVTTSLAHDVLLTPGAAIERAFGFTTAGRISGYVYMDANVSGTRDSGEAGLGGWRVFLDTNNNGLQDAGEVGKTAKSDGRFVFDALASGTYTIRVIPRDGYRPTYPKSNAFTLTIAQAGTYSRKFGLKRITA